MRGKFARTRKNLETKKERGDAQMSFPPLGVLPLPTSRSSPCPRKCGAQRRNHHTGDYADNLLPPRSILEGRARRIAPSWAEHTPDRDYRHDYEGSDEQDPGVIHFSALLPKRKTCCCLPFEARLNGPSKRRRRKKKLHPLIAPHNLCQRTEAFERP